MIAESIKLELQHINSNYFKINYSSHTFDKTFSSLYNGLTKIQGGFSYEFTQTHHERANRYPLHPAR